MFPFSLVPPPPFLPLSLVLPLPLLAGPALIPMVGKEMRAPSSEEFPARSCLPPRLSPPAPAKRKNPPRRGYVRRRRGRVSRVWEYTLHGTRASKSEQS